MAWYCTFKHLKTYKKNLANIQPSWPCTRSITHSYDSTKLSQEVVYYMTLEFGRFQKQKSTHLQPVSVEMVCMAKSSPGINHSAQIYLKTTLPYNKLAYYSFKIFPCFWLVKTTRIIEHNQLLLTKFAKNFVIFNRWRQKCSPRILLNHWPRKPGDEVI